MTTFEAVVVIRTPRPALDGASARRLLRELRRRLPVPHASASVVVGDDALLRGLNKTYRRKDRPTDVLSFPSNEISEGGRRHLGDIVISSDAARRQARRRGHSAKQEVRILMIHGYLHLLGYDHETDEGQMELLERSVRRDLLGGRGPRR
ncbi:MAG TPA: rRNA maturation RNase YbeY [Candidatus Polarisedimenticolia bacterium]|nr:rRNA maturation RNase YbeY [Candidatus Polarisedimenticolia bacterium]